MRTSCEGSGFVLPYSLHSGLAAFWAVATRIDGNIDSPGPGWRRQMLYHVTVSFGKDRQYQYKFSQAELAEGTPEEEMCIRDRV